ncbi:MAG: hypothetical protein AAFO29_19290 [Actinomycetota bacterium]
MIPGFLVDIAALPRFIAGSLPWWAVPAGVVGLWFTAGSIRAAARLALFLTALTVGTFLAATAWLADHPNITTGDTEAAETVGSVR